MIQDMGDFGFDTASGAPPAVIGKVCVWLLESTDADALNGQNRASPRGVRRARLAPGMVTRAMSTNDGGPTISIVDGVEVPLVGLGTWQSSGKQAYDAVRSALDIGCRHIDTATAYGNEKEVGRAVRESGLARDDVFVTTKLPPENAGRERETLEASLERDGPRPDRSLARALAAERQVPPEDLGGVHRGARRGSDAAAIGVSNYSTQQIDELVESTGVAPAVNQIRWSPSLFDGAVVAAHREPRSCLRATAPSEARTSMRRFWTRSQDDTELPHAK